MAGGEGVGRGEGHGSSHRARLEMGKRGWGKRGWGERGWSEREWSRKGVGKHKHHKRARASEEIYRVKQDEKTVKMAASSPPFDLQC